MPTKVHGARFEGMEEQEVQEQIESKELNFLDDVYLPVSIELGRTKMMIKEIRSPPGAAGIENR